MKQVTKHKVASSKPPTPNVETIDAMQAARCGDLKKVSSVEALFNDLNDDEERLSIARTNSPE